MCVAAWVAGTALSALSSQTAPRGARMLATMNRNRFPGSDTIVITGLGEAIYDILESGPVLGGAPVNVAVHVRQLLTALGVESARVAVATRVGADPLGVRFLKEAVDRGLEVAAVQVDPEAPTGTATVRLRNGEPSFELAPACSWDRLEFLASTRELAMASTAVCFGSLASRTPGAARAVEAFLDGAAAALKLFDVNVRPPFVEPTRIRRLCERADILKVNEAELPIVGDALGLPPEPGAGRLETLRRAAGLDLVVMTCGSRGAVVASADGIERVAATSFPAAPDADAIGAGDAFSAALLTGLVLGRPLRDTLRLASFTAACVAARRGATPMLPELPLEFRATC